MTKILSYKLVYLNSLISISTESTMSEELADTTTVTAIITKKKTLNEKENEELFGSSFGYIKDNIFGYIG